MASYRFGGEPVDAVLGTGI